MLFEFTESAEENNTKLNSGQKFFQHVSFLHFYLVVVVMFIPDNTTIYIDGGFFHEIQDIQGDLPTVRARASFTPRYFHSSTTFNFVGEKWTVLTVPQWKILHLFIDSR